MASEKVTQFIDDIKALSVIELNELVKALEEEFGVTAAAVAVAGGGSGDAAAAAEEQTEFDVTLTSFGDAKIAVIKVVREITGLGLKDAKALVDAVPGVLKEGVDKEEADSIKEKIEEAGGQVEIK